MLKFSFSDLESMSEYFSLPAWLAMWASRITAVSLICVLLLSWICCG